MVCCPDGLVDSTGRRGSSAGRLPLVREEAVGTGDRQPPWREPWWWLLLLEGWSWWSWLLWLPQTGCKCLGTWNGRQTTAAMKHHVGDYQGCHCYDQDFSKLDENDYHFTEHSWNWNRREWRNDGLLFFSSSLEDLVIINYERWWVKWWSDDHKQVLACITLWLMLMVRCMKPGRFLHFPWKILYSSRWW